MDSVCSLHQNRLFEFYCDDCKMNVCSHCVVRGQHQTHSVTTMEERVRIVVALLAMRSRLVKLSFCGIASAYNYNIFLPEPDGVGRNGGDCKGGD